MASGTRSSALPWVASLWTAAGIIVASIPSGGVAQSASQPTASAKASVSARYARLPLAFESNQGQAAQGVEFVARGGGYTLSLTRTAAVLALRGPKPVSRTRRFASPTGPSALATRASSPATIHMDVVDASPGAHIAGEDPFPGTVNYFLGNDPAKWQSHVPTYASVRCTNVYPGIDLVYYGNRRQLEYDFRLAPHADPARIRLQFRGADRLAITQAGDLAISTAGSQISFRKPTVFQQIGSLRRPVSGRFVLRAGNTVGFEVGRYDRSRPLVIDPTLVYATYLGGSGFPGDEGDAIAVDKDGNLLIAGSTDSTDFPVTTGAFQTTDSASSDANVLFVTKLNPTGTALVYSTYIGGTSGDWEGGLATDASGDVFVAGYTYSKDYPVTQGAFMTTNTAWQHSAESAFVTELSADGSSLVYSTFLSGTGDGGFGDEAKAIAVDGNGNAYVTGEAYSMDFPVTQGAFQTKNNATDSGSNAFLAKLNSTGTALVYSTYIGGSGASLVGEQGNAVAIDSNGNAYIAGHSYSSDFPVTKGAFQQTNPGAKNGAPNAFVAKFNVDGTALSYATYLGGNGIATYGDLAYGLAVDKSGNTYVTGETYSSNFPVTAGAFQGANNAASNGSSNVFVTKLNAQGSALIYSTYIGGSGQFESPGDLPAALAIDAGGNAYITGSAYSADYPVTSNALQSTNRAAHLNESNPFVTLVNAAGSGLLFSTYLGGTEPDYGNALVTDGAGNVYIAGTAYSTDFPVTKGAYQTQNLAAPNNGTTVFAAKLNLSVLTGSRPSKTALTSNANPGTPKAAVLFTAKVSAVTGLTVPTGQVVFSVNGVTVSTSDLNSSGGSAISLTISKTGSYSIKAAYGGDANFAPSAAGLTEVIRMPVAAAPRFSPSAGPYSPGVLVTLSDATKGAAIHYTTNGKAPIATSTRFTGPIKIMKTTTIRAIAVESGYTNSAVASATYTIKLPAPAPVFSPAAGSYKLPVTVKITDKATAGLAIYYTTNGTAPTLTSTRYTSAGIKVARPETIKAIAVATGYSKSAVASAAYKAEGAALSTLRSDPDLNVIPAKPPRPSNPFDHP